MVRTKLQSKMYLFLSLEPIQPRTQESQMPNTPNCSQNEQSINTTVHKPLKPIKIRDTKLQNMQQTHHSLTNFQATKERETKQVPKVKSQHLPNHCSRGQSKFQVDKYVTKSFNRESSPCELILLRLKHMNGHSQECHPQ